MKLNKKSSSKHDRSAGIDNDFASIFYESKLEKFKPIIKILVVMIVIAGIGYGGLIFFNRDNKGVDNSTYTPSTSQAEESSEETEGTPQSLVDTPSSSTSNTPQPSSPTATGSTSSNESTYDPRKCDPQKNEAARLKTVADQKKIAFDNAFNARKSYGDIYNEVRSKYGDSSSMYQVVAAETDRIVKAEEDLLNQLQADWQDALNKGNAAYSKYQECQSANFSQ